MNTFQFFSRKRLSCIAILLITVSSMLTVSTRNAYAMHFNGTNYTTTTSTPSNNFFASMFGNGTVDGFTSTLIEAATLEATLNMVQQSGRGDDFSMVNWLQIGVLGAYLGTGILNLGIKKIINWKWPTYTDDYYGVVIRKSCKGCEAMPVSESLGLTALPPDQVPPKWLRMVSKGLAIANSFTTTAGTSAFQAWWSGYFAQIYGANEPYKKAGMVMLGRHLNFLVWPLSQGVLEFKYEKLVDSAQQMAVAKNSNLRTVGDGTVYLFTTAVGDFVAMQMGLEPWTTADGGFVSLLFQQVQNQIYRTFHENYRWRSARTMTKAGVNALVEGFDKRVNHYHTFLPSNYWVWQLQTVMASIPGTVRIFWPGMQKMNPVLEFAMVVGLNLPRKVVTVINEVKMDMVSPPYNFAQMAVMKGYPPTRWGQTRAFLDSLVPIHNFLKHKGVRITREDAEAILISLGHPSRNICCGAFSVDRQRFNELLATTKALHKTFANLPEYLDAIDPAYLRAVGKNKASRSAFVSKIMQYYPVTLDDEIAINIARRVPNIELVQPHDDTQVTQNLIGNPVDNVTRQVMQVNEYHDDYQAVSQIDDYE